MNPNEQALERRVVQLEKENKLLFERIEKVLSRCEMVMCRPPWVVDGGWQPVVPGMRIETTASPPSVPSGTISGNTFTGTSSASWHVPVSMMNPSTTPSASSSEELKASACSKCNGKRTRFSDFHQKDVPCEDCGGMGTVRDEK
jgi:hypothetical protein